MKTLVFCLFLLSASIQATAGSTPPLKGILKPFHPIVLGISGVVIDDDDRPFKGVFSIKDSWNSSYIPSRITFEGSFLKKWSAEFSMAYSPLQAGKILGDNNNRRLENVKLYTFDLSAKYYPFSLGAKLLSPYAIIGLGYTNKAGLVSNNGASANAGLGLSIWLDKSLGVNVQAMGKFGINKRASNYLMHTLGIVYRIAK